MLKFAFVGLGSIATRHIRNLKYVLGERRESFSIDVISSHRKKEISDELKGIISNIYYFQDDIPGDYDAIFITNPTSMHYEAIVKYAPRAKNLFIEKPVFDKLDISVKELGLQQDGKYYVACPLRYNAVLNYIKENIDFKNVFSVRAVSSSYLPEWRPGTDYRDTYSAHKSLGGGVSIDLIHEWDYITHFWGFPQNVYSLIGKFSELEIDSDDLAVYIADYGNMSLELHLDYFGRKTIRQLQLFCGEDTITANIADGYVLYEKSGKKIVFSEERDAYQRREMEHFLDIIAGKIENDSTIEDAIRVLGLTKGEIL